MLSDDIRYLTGRALWETENLIKCIPDELWNKRYDGIPMWKYLYHTLYSMDRWYINPGDISYENPEFHTDTLADLYNKIIVKGMEEKHYGRINQMERNSLTGFTCHYPK